MNTPEPKDIIDIPQISNRNAFEKNQERAYEEGFEHCPVCGRAIRNPKYFFHSIYGGCAYPASDNNKYNDAWEMGVGSECMKQFPKGYVYEKK